MRSYIYHNIHPFSRIEKLIKKLYTAKDAAPETSRPPARTFAAAIAKWLVPSISALFITVGYVVISAHQNLLGIESQTFSTSDCIVNASVFLYDLFTLLPDAALGIVTLAHLPSFDITEICLLAAALLFSVMLTVIGKDKFHINNSNFRQYLLVFIILSLVFSKFIILDAPLSIVENVLTNEGSRSNNESKFIPIEKRLENSRHGGWLDKIVSQRALRIWTVMVCSRVSYDMLKLNKNPVAQCTCNEHTSNHIVQSEFIAHSILSILLLAISLQILRRTNRHNVAVIAILVSAYTFTWPYAYGKLVKATNYKYGQIIFKSGLTSSVSALSNKSTAASLPSAMTEHAIIFESGATTCKLLVMKESSCPVLNNSPSEFQAKMQEAKLWEIPNSEITAIKEIYWEDVIAWKIRNEKACPPVNAQPPSAS
jgi:hypothetical protein